MAEFCLKCFREEILESEENIPNEKIVMSEEEDFCEGCGEWKQVVVRVKK